MWIYFRQASLVLPSNGTETLWLLVFFLEIWDAGVRLCSLGFMKTLVLEFCLRCVFIISFAIKLKAKRKQSKILFKILDTFGFAASHLFINPSLNIKVPQVAAIIPNLQKFLLLSWKSFQKSNLACQTFFVFITWKTIENLYFIINIVCLL